MTCIKMYGICTMNEHMATTWFTVVWFAFTTFIPPLCIYVYMLAMFLTNPRYNPSKNTDNVESEELKNPEESTSEDRDPVYDLNCDSSTSSCEYGSSDSDIFEESDDGNTPDCDVVATPPSEKKEL